MLKRSLSLIILVFASTIWLAYAIFPHHHHDFQACLEIKHCQHDSENQNQFPEADSHKHDSNATSGCALDQMAVVPQTILKSNSNLQDTLRIDTDFIQAIVYYTHSTALLSSKTYAKHSIGFSTKLFLAYIGNSIGLRAPPAA